MNARLQHTLDKKLRCAAYDGNIPQAEQLLAEGANANSRDTGWNTVLHYAACSLKSDTAKLLMKAGADVNMQNKQGNTPMHYAACYGRVDCMRILIEAGADMYIDNNDGYTPVDMLKKVNPGLYGAYIDELMAIRPEVKQLTSEDTKKTLCSCFEFDL